MVTSDTAASAATVGPVLGVAVLPMALGAFLLIPRAAHVAERAAEDMRGMERTVRSSVAEALYEQSQGGG